MEADITIDLTFKISNMSIFAIEILMSKAPLLQRFLL